MDMKMDETGKAIVPVLACVLNQLCQRNDRLPLSSKNISKFHALRPPAISIKDYLNRIAKYAACSGECFVLALVYVDRIIQANPTFVVNSLNIHRLLITSVMLAAKFFDDQYFNNAYYAKVGGVPCSEMNSLEVEFLFMTNFTLFVATDTYKQYYTELCNHALNAQCGCSTTPLPKLVIPAFKPRSDSITARHKSIDEGNPDGEIVGSMPNSGLGSYKPASVAVPAGSYNPTSSIPVSSNNTINTSSTTHPANTTSSLSSALAAANHPSSSNAGNGHHHPQPQSSSVAGSNKTDMVTGAPPIAAH